VPQYAARCADPDVDPMAPSKVAAREGGTFTGISPASVPPHETHDTRKAGIGTHSGSLRALIDGSEPDEPNRAHAVTIAYVVADAIDRN
jgi:hypothetical protein